MKHVKSSSGGCVLTLPTASRSRTRTHTPGWKERTTSGIWLIMIRNTWARRSCAPEAARRSGSIPGTVRSKVTGAGTGFTLASPTTLASMTIARSYMAAKQKYHHIITQLHNEWCRANGYPERKPSSTVRMAGRPKAQGSSFKPSLSRSKIREPEYKR